MMTPSLDSLILSVVEQSAAEGRDDNEYRFSIDNSTSE
jgi:hypothetical protein